LDRRIYPGVVASGCWPRRRCSGRSQHGMKMFPLAMSWRVGFTNWVARRPPRCCRTRELRSSVNCWALAQSVIRGPMAAPIEFRLSIAGQSPHQLLPSTCACATAMDRDHVCSGKCSSKKRFTFSPITLRISSSEKPAFNIVSVNTPSSLASNETLTAPS